MTPLLICTDLDGTLIAHERQQQFHSHVLQLKESAHQQNALLVYVSGRHLASVQDAMREFRLPQPDYVITDVGTAIYTYQKQSWQALAHWQGLIKDDWRGLTQQQVADFFSSFQSLQLQEPEKQQPYKLSFYFNPVIAETSLVQQINITLAEQQLQSNIILSYDEHKTTGYLDILPKKADKYQAIRFLQLESGMQHMVFAGDSGNDMSVLSSDIPAVLVGNANQDVRDKATQLSKEAGHTDKLYLAEAFYSAGILEGIRHYYPQFQ